MRNFWLFVVLAMGASLVCIFLWFSPAVNSWQPSTAQRVIVTAATALLVGLIWAVLFRSQVERRRVGVFALLVLLTLEAGWLAAMRFFAD